MNLNMRAFTVCVNFQDLLRLTLPYMRHQFADYYIATDLANYDEVLSIADKHDAQVFATDAFYSEGCPFRKWLAFEMLLDHFGRDGWIVALDVDIVWPKETDCYPVDPLTRFTKGIDPTRNYVPGRLYTPLRRMYPAIPDKVPDEPTWGFYPVHRNIQEWASYSHIMHSSDSHLERLPWYNPAWKTCAGADSELQARWAPKDKIRPAFECLHFGTAGENWAGRTQRMQDGSLPPDYDKHREEINKLWASRRARRGYDNPTEKIL